MPPAGSAMFFGFGELVDVLEPYKQGNKTHTHPLEFAIPYHLIENTDPEKFDCVTALLTLYIPDLAKKPIPGFKYFIYGKLGAVTAEHVNSNHMQLDDYDFVIDCLDVRLSSLS